jgi:hypothetical protein
LPDQERCLATKELIKDLELMANADFVVGSSTSGIPGLVATLRMILYNKQQVRQQSPKLASSCGHVHCFPCPLRQQWRQPASEGPQMSWAAASCTCVLQALFAG